MANNSFNTKVFRLVGIGLAAMFLVYCLGSNSFLYRMSVLHLPEHKPFDGTVYPIKKVPNWSKLGSAKYNAGFDELSNSDLIEIPRYDATTLEFPTEKLVWNNPEHEKIRNAKITYSVPYMGNYKFDGHEHVGSHAAVDIKAPEGTPVVAIANGTVSKVSRINSGFGYHVVINHNNFPSLKNKNTLATIYSSYSHMSEISVEVGDTVTKGEQIGKVGHTGTATTPHLHFQIDTDLAPWHPYWPFDWKDMADAGLSFFEAINAGLGAENAKDTTIHPMQYVTKYLDAKATSSNTASSNTTAIPEETGVEVKVDTKPSNSYVPADDVSDEVEDDEEEFIEDEEEEEVAPYLIFEIKASETYVEGRNGTFEIRLVDQFGKQFIDGFRDEISVTSDERNFKVNSSLVTTLQFNREGIYVGNLKDTKEGRDRVVVEYDGKEYHSDWFEIVPVKTEISFSDVRKSNNHYEAVQYLASNGLVNGYGDGTFKPASPVNRVEALKFILTGTEASLSTGSLKFKDTDDAAWYAPYIFTAKRKNIVQGYEDGSFKPVNTVSLAEFIKMLFEGMNVKVEKAGKREWYVPYLEKALEMGILDGSLDELSPNKPMSRGEVSEAIFRLMTSVEE